MGMYGPNRIMNMKYIPSKDDDDYGTVCIEFDDSRVSQFTSSYKEYLDFKNLVETLSK